MLRTIYVKIGLILLSLVVLIFLILSIFTYTIFDKYQNNIPSSVVPAKFMVSEDSSGNENVTYSILNKTDIINYVDLKHEIIKVIIIIVIISILLIPVLIKLIMKIVKNDLVAVNNLESIDTITTKINQMNNSNLNLVHDVNTINSYINHEFKNMLNVMNSHVLNNDQVKTLNYIGEMNVIIDDINILTSNKIDLIVVDLLDITASIIDKYLSRGLSIDFNFTDDLFEVLGHSVWMNRMIVNIIDNAYKYGASHVDVDLSVSHNNVILEIANNGPKIESDKLDLIFNYKYQINNLNENGSGIGLSLVRAVVDNSKGSIFVKSDEMTSFYISIPLTNN